MSLPLQPLHSSKSLYIPVVDAKIYSASLLLCASGALAATAVAVSNNERLPISVRVRVLASVVQRLVEGVHSSVKVSAAVRSSMCSCDVCNPTCVSIW